MRRDAVLIAIVLTLFSGGVVASAGAEQRAWTCAPGSGEYSDTHCVNNTTGSFKAVEISNGSPVIATVTNLKTAESTTAAALPILKGNLAGVELEIRCTTVGGTGKLTNSASSVSGTGTIELSGCSITKPAGRGCVIAKGLVTSKLLTATTAGQPANKLEYKPNSGTEFAGIPIEGCAGNKPPANTYPVMGSLIDSTSGATATITHASSTTQGTLTFGGNAAGIEGALTLSGEGGNPIFLK